MSLREYNRKRHFGRTPEPGGRSAAKEGRAFVVQKHAASRLHYDFRLELHGVLKSWAVPKGPSLDPKVKRLAIQVEDHPVEYGSFEGNIPEGEYGAGSVMLWDRGNWEPAGDADNDYRQGQLKFTLHGEKLRGRWMLVRTGADNQARWLLFKERDEEAKPTDEGEILDEMPLSVASGRTMDEIAKDKKIVKAQAKGKSDRRSTTRRVKPTAPGSADYDAARQQFAGVRLTSPEKVLYPEIAIAKLDLAKYYLKVADWILPHLANRPLVLVRCPEGRENDCFYQKHPPAGSPAALRQISVPESTKVEQYVVVDDAAGLISLAQIAALEIHAWGARADKLDFPDRLVFDFDPDPTVPWSRVVQSARQVRDFLVELGLQSFVKTTGGKGLHLVVPIDRRHDWDEAKGFCKRTAELIAAADPARYTVNMTKAARTGRIYIDYLRNSRGATAIAPYSTRARPGATVSTPLSWEELSTRIPSDHYTVRNLARRLASLKRDPWEGIADVRQGLAGAMKKVQALSRG